MPLDEARIQEFVGKLVGDMGAAFTAPLILLGDRLGLYKAVAESGGATSEQIAERTGLDPRYVREWLAAQAAAGNLSFDADANLFRMSEEQRLAFADENSPFFMPVRTKSCSRCFTTSNGSRMDSEAVRASVGTNTIRAYSAAPNASSVPGTPLISCRSGYQRSTA